MKRRKYGENRIKDVTDVVNSVAVPGSGGQQHLHTLSASLLGCAVQRRQAVVGNCVEAEPKGNIVKHQAARPQVCVYVRV
jgi:hypothetical protein